MIYNKLESILLIRNSSTKTRSKNAEHCFFSILLRLRTKSFITMSCLARKNFFNLRTVLSKNRGPPLSDTSLHFISVKGKLKIASWTLNCLRDHKNSWRTYPWFCQKFLRLCMAVTVLFAIGEQRKEMSCSFPQSLWVSWWLQKKEKDYIVRICLSIVGWGPRRLTS